MKLLEIFAASAAGLYLVDRCYFLLVRGKARIDALFPVHCCENDQR